MMSAYYRMTGEWREHGRPTSVRSPAVGGRWSETFAIPPLPPLPPAALADLATMAAAGAPAALGAAAPEAVVCAEALEDLLAIQVDVGQSPSGDAVPAELRCCDTRGCLVHLRTFHRAYADSLDAQRASFVTRRAAASRHGGAASRRRGGKGKDTLLGPTGTGCRR